MHICILYIYKKNKIKNRFIERSAKFICSTTDKRRKEDTYYKTRNEGEVITTYHADIKWTIMGNYEQRYVHKLSNSVKLN